MEMYGVTFLRFPIMLVQLQIWMLLIINGNFHVAYITDSNNTLESLYNRNLIIRDANGAIIATPVVNSFILEPTEINFQPT